MNNHPPAEPVVFHNTGIKPSYYWPRPEAHVRSATRKPLLFPVKRVAEIQRQLISRFIFFQLMRYVLLDLLCILSNRVYIVSTAPELSVPILVLLVSPFLLYHQAAFPFQISHELRNTVLRRYFNQHVYMVWAYFCFQYGHSLPLAQCSQYRSYLLSFFSVEHFSSILRCEYNVVLTIPRCVR